MACPTLKAHPYSAFKCIKQECRYSIHLVVCVIHDELNTRRNLTELPNNEFVPAPRIKVNTISLLKKAQSKLASYKKIFTKKNSGAAKKLSVKKSK